MIKISKAEFEARVLAIQERMKEAQLDALMVYGDEYRRENLRYVSNYWPIFERGACFIPSSGSPVLAGAPEGEAYAREMTIWDDVRNLVEFQCVSVPDAIEYPMANFTTLHDILGEQLAGGKRLGIVGESDMPRPIYERVRSAADGAELVQADELLRELRLIKSEAEIACMREAGRQACIGYEKLMEACVPGNTEREAAAAGEGAARAAGAEYVVFSIMATGERTNTIIGRATNKRLEEGDMIMAGLAVQFEGYIATAAYPFTLGKPSDGQKAVLNALFEAANAQLAFLKDGVPAADMVKAVKAVFVRREMERYDLYPPMHGAGLAEAESPYPNEKSDYAFRSGMCVNSDVSLFGHAAGSNRVEEGFVIREDGPESITPGIRKLMEKHCC